MNRRYSYLRPRGAHDSAKVTMVELLFDLVFVFAVTQLSHTLLTELSWHKASQVGVMLVAVWSVWLYTAWVTNWLDPDRVPVRLFLFAMMLVGLVMSASIPKAFAEYGRAFGGAFVVWLVAWRWSSLRRHFCG